MIRILSLIFSLFLVSFFGDLLSDYFVYGEAKIRKSFKNAIGFYFFRNIHW